MKIYRVLTWQEVEGIINNRFEIHSRWSLEPPANAVMISSVRSMQDNARKQLYVLEYESGGLPVQILMAIMHQELSLAEVKRLFDDDKTLERLFFAYISNSGNSSLGSIGKRLDDLATQ